MSKTRNPIDNGKLQKLHILPKIFLIITAIYILFIIVLNTYVVVTEDALKYAIIALPVIAGCFFLGYKLKISPRTFLVGIFVAALITKAVMAILTKTVPVSDFNTFYSCAVKLFNGDKSWSESSYFSDWAYQTGPITYYAFLMKLFGTTAILPLKLTNCIFMAGTNTFIYLLARKITNERAARTAALVYMLYPAPYFLTSVLTNQHFAACMFMAAIYVLQSDRLNLVVRGVLAGVFASLGNMVRPLGILIIAALIVWAVIELIRSKKFISILTAAVMLTVYLAGNWGLSSALKYEEISPYGLANNFPLWKFVVGLNSDTYGQFSYNDQNDIFYMKDKAKRNEVALATIKQRLKIGSQKLTEFFVIKQRIMWADLDTLRWAFYELNEKGGLKPPKNFGINENRALKTERIYYFLVYILLFIGLVIVIKRKKNISSTAIYIMLLLMAYYFIHIFIEIQMRYRYFATILVFILLSYGIEYSMEKIKRLKKA